MTRTNTTDEFFIDAPPHRVYEALTDGKRIAEWWPGVRAGGDTDRIAIRAPGFRRRASSVSFEARLDGHRPGEGVTWWLDRGELYGRAEWWFEAFKAGTIVHYDLDVERGNRGRARRISSAVRRHRWAVRRGLNALKDRLEGRG
ncbi:MAG: SRPBCC family protein [Actinomycetota bacterium]